MNSENKNRSEKFAFFGTDDFSVAVLERLFEKGFIPTLIVTAPDRPAGRGQQIQSPAAKIWAENKNLAGQKISILQPEKLDSDFISEIKQISGENSFVFFIVASYGKIIPEVILKLPKKGTLNVHPSLLPMYRGASPIETAILDDNKETGVTIMLMDKDMDHGPILEQEFVDITEWPKKLDLEKQFAEIGGELLSQIIPMWLSGEIIEQEQDHDYATFTKKIKKEDGLIEITDLNIDFPKLEKRSVFLKVKALNPWPGVYFFVNHLGRQTRIKITDADFIDEKTVITKVIPEGKKEMTFADFKKGFGFTF
jgi:methionyl-tRNA formyltransferase